MNVNVLNAVKLKKVPYAYWAIALHKLYTVSKPD